MKNAVNDSESGDVTISNDDINSHASLVKTVKDFDKKSIKQVLENKEQKVGDVLLVNGRPAIVKKRKKHSQPYEQQMQTFSNTANSEDDPEEQSNRKPFARKLLKTRKIVRVKVRARQGITVDNVQDQVGKKGRRKPVTEMPGRQRAVKRRKLNSPESTGIISKEKDNKRIILNSFEDLNSLTNKARQDMKVHFPTTTQQSVSPRYQTTFQSYRNMSIPTSSTYIFHPNTNQIQTNSYKTTTAQIQPSPLPPNPAPTSQFPPPQFPAPQPTVQPQPFLGHPASNINLQTGAFTLTTFG